MTPESEQRLNACLEYLELKVVYENDLPDNVAGLLDPVPDPRYIILNPRKSRSDQVFTIAHEMAHYVAHHGKPDWNMVPQYLKIPWSGKLICKFHRALRHFVRRKFTREWYADMYAFIMLWTIGAGNDLIEIQKLHPEKRRMFWYTFVFAVYFAQKRRIGLLLQRLRNPPLLS